MEIGLARQVIANRQPLIMSTVFTHQFHMLTYNV
jgi:hypothetical protein